METTGNFYGSKKGKLKLFVNFALIILITYDIIIINQTRFGNIRNYGEFYGNQNVLFHGYGQGF